MTTLSAFRRRRDPARPRAIEPEKSHVRTRRRRPARHYARPAFGARG
jgi:hypothetical protein